MIYKVVMLGKVLAQFKDDFERARNYADRFPAAEDVEVYEDQNLVFIKFNK